MSLGQIGYEAYKASTGGKTFDGRDMPTWAEVQERTPHVAKAWQDAAGAVAKQEIGPIRRDDTFSFSVALHLLKSGAKVARAGWNGKGMWIALTPGSVIPDSMARNGAAMKLAEQRSKIAAKSRESGIYAHDLGDCPPIQIGAHLDMKAADGSLVIGWLASQTDMLAHDWVLVE